jgi:amino acid transporter
MSLRHESDPDDDGVVDINFDIAMAPMSSASVSPVNSARTGQEDDESSRPILGPHDHDDEHEGGDADVDAEDPVSIQSYRPKLSFVNGLAIVVGLQIGSGIFSAPVQVSNHVSSPGEGVLVWFLAGLLVWTGASSFIELGIAIPENGGVQEYLRFCYGDLAGFIFTWTWVGIAKPAAMGIISIVFADYLCSSISPSAEPSPFVIKAVGLLGLGSITFVNCLGIKTGATAANGFLALKLFAVYSIIIFGAILLINKNAEGVGSPKHGWWDNQSPDAIGSVWSRLGRFVTAIYGALFCYGGWETVRSPVLFINASLRSSQIT